MRYWPWMVVLCLCFGLAFPVGASAIGIVKSSNGVILQRESGDTTAAATVYIYYDYKGSADTTWSSAWAPTATGSWRQSVGYTSMLTAGIGDTVELDLVPGWRLQCVYVVAGSTPLGMFAVINEPLDVHVANPSLGVAVSNPTTHVAIIGTVTVEPTGSALSRPVTVSVESSPTLSAEDSENLALAAGSGVVGGFALFGLLGYTLTRGA